MKAVGDALERHLDELSGLSPAELRADRYRRFRELGALEDRVHADTRGESQERRA